MITTQLTGWYYTIDLGNVYHRGPLFGIPVALSAGLMLAAFIIILVNRRHIGKKPFISLLLVAVPPFLGIMVQMFFTVSPFF